MRYRNSKEGVVDDVTLGELISSRRIKHFYRPSEKNWVDIEVGPLRARAVPYRGPERRWPQPPPDEGREAGPEKPRGFFSKFRKHHRPRESQKPTASDYYEWGYQLSNTAQQFGKAARAFAQCIRSDPRHTKAYLQRGMSYERLGNFQQAIEDYGRAIELSPGDAVNYYIRGFAYLRSGMAQEAKKDIRTAAEMGYRLARDYLRHRKDWM